MGDVEIDLSPLDPVPDERQSRWECSLLAMKARPREGCTDNCSNLLRAFKKLLLTLGGDDLLQQQQQQQLQMSCGIHTSLLVLDDLAKGVTDVAEYLRWLKDAMSSMHRPRIKHELPDHVREKMPMIQKPNWNTKVKASSTGSCSR
jgi:hypothetical protein